MKTYFKYAFLLLFINTAFSQLTVRNSAYIYVTDEVVFVEDDVSLKESNSMFYLRDDAQLIQGTGTTGNSGIGKLSVFQNGTVDNYAYNYWCSPVGNTDADALGNSAYRGNNNMFDWTGSGTPSLHQITSTAAAFTFGYDGSNSPLTISQRWIYSYNPGTDYSDWDHIGATGNLDAGYGFSMKGTSGSSMNQLYDFRGKPNSGDIPTEVLSGQNTLVGNPYPSALDARDYIHDATNSTLINGSLYFWEHDPSVDSHNVADYIGGYASLTVTSGGLATFVPATFDTYNSDGSMNTTGSSSVSSKTVGRYIPIGQGFMVEGIGNGTIYARNSHRNHEKPGGSNSIFFKDGSSNTNSEDLPEDYKRFRLNIDLNDSKTTQVVQTFHDTATDGFDYGLEIKQPIDENYEVYFQNDGEDSRLSAQAFKFDSDIRIPLYFDLPTQKTVRVRIHDVQNFDDGQDIFLHDIEDDVYYNLIDLNFETTMESGSSNSRYELTFKNFNILDVTEFDSSDFSILQNNNTANLTVLNPSSLEIKELSIYDISGKRVLREVNLSNKSRYEFSTRNLSDGTYIAKINLDKNNKAINKKIIINNKK